MRWVFTYLAVLAACGGRPTIQPAPVPLAHDAYVWQRDWTGPVREAVAGAPSEIGGLRVLVREVGERAATPVVDTVALATAHRPVTLVVRIDGARLPDGITLAPERAEAEAWRAAGVTVAGIEVDHDCATGALGAYARWLARERPHAITALPTWASAPAALREVVGAVDEVVVQVHAVRAPTIFDRKVARRDLEAFAAAAGGARLRVAVPTYRVVVGGTPLAADPIEVADFVRELERDPIDGVVGVAWFRLPVASDRATWRTETLAAAIANRPLVARVASRLVTRGGDTYDVVVANTGTLDARFPALQLGGAVVASDLVAPPADRTLAAGSEIVAGWATGKDLTLDAL